MGKLLNLITDQHLSTKRNYLERVNNKKPKLMKNAKKYSFDYWDGTRKQGYGGYKYIPGRWKKTAEKIIRIRFRNHEKPVPKSVKFGA